MSAKTATVTITVSTNPTFSERYFVDFRDTTGGVNRQLRTWHLNSGPVHYLLSALQEQASQAGVSLTVADTTGEVC